MKHFREAGILVLALSAIFLSGCQKNSDSPAGPADTGSTLPPGAAVSVERRMEILDGFTTLANSVNSVDQSVAAQQLLANLKSKPEIARAGISSTGSVWAVFTDGRLFLHSFSFENTELNPNAAAASLTPLPKPLAKTTDNLPSTKTATVLNALGSAFDLGNFLTGYYGADQTRQDIAGFLTSAGYTVRSGNDASVAGLKRINGDDAIFHITTHGDLGHNYDTTQTYYGIWTTDEVQSVAEDGFKTELDNGELCYFSAPNKRGGLLSRDESECHYAITDKFVLHYMHFGKNSLVYITACSSFSSDAGLLVDAFGIKLASVYLGWTEPTSSQDAFYAARFFFDRALGMNKVKPIPVPPQRPFEYQLVVEDMIHRKIDHTTTVLRGRTVDAVLRFRTLQGDFMQFLPTVLLCGYLNLPQLYVNGLFGDTQGIVKLNGSTLPWDSWTNRTIAMPMPETGGNLVVEVNGLKSNAVPMTEWKGTMVYTFTGRGSLKLTATLNVNLIADVHRYRVLSGGNPIQPDNDTYGSARYMYLSNLSSGTYAASGEYRNPLTDNVDESWSGGGSIQRIPFGTVGNDGFSIVGSTEDVGGNASIAATMTASYSRFVRGTGTFPATMTIENGVGTIKVVVGPGFVLPQQTNSVGTARLDWSAVTPKFVQTSTDQR